MNKILPSLLILLVTANIITGQTPQAMNYQAIARNATGAPLQNQHVSLRLTIKDGINPGTPLYQETDTATTNQFGLFTTFIGKGTAALGTFTGITWATGNKYLEVELDVTGGNNYTSMGTTELLSVPYALYAQTSGNGATGATGATGTNGTIGATGATGATGTNGTIGETGATGATGTNGTIGATGATGATGTNGTIGATGATGATGTNGTIGATGATGAFGLTGTTGQTIFNNGSAWTATSNLYNTGTSVSINVTGTPADSSAMLDISATTKGFLTPRMTTSQRTAINNPATGLLVFQTDSASGFYFYNGNTWQYLNAVSSQASTNQTLLYTIKGF